MLLLEEVLAHNGLARDKLDLLRKTCTESRRLWGRISGEGDSTNRNVCWPMMWQRTSANDEALVRAGWFDSREVEAKAGSKLESWRMCAGIGP